MKTILEREFADLEELLLEEIVQQNDAAMERLEHIKELIAEL